MAGVATKTELEEFLGHATPSRLWRYGKWVGIIAALLIVVLVRSQWFPTAPRIAYITSEVRRGDIAVTVTATGNLAATKQVEVGSEISGIVVQVLVDVND